MFIMSMKLEKRKMLTIGVVIVGLILLGIGLFSIFSGKGGGSKKPNKGGFEAANNAQRVAFLESFGWDVSDEPIEVCEIILPENFDEVYKRYNELQKTQGLNLDKYKGRRAKRWTYMVLNYPSDDEVHANVIVCDDKIVAGDICSVALGGFIHGFSPDEVGAFAEHGLLASDLPYELNGIEKPKSKQKKGESSAPQDNENNDNQGNVAGENQGNTAGENQGNTAGENQGNAPSENQGNTGSAAGENQGNAGENVKENKNKNNQTAEMIDDIEQQAREEIENALEMLIQAAEDKKG